MCKGNAGGARFCQGCYQRRKRRQYLVMAAAGILLLPLLWWLIGSLHLDSRPRTGPRPTHSAASAGGRGADNRHEPSLAEMVAQAAKEPCDVNKILNLVNRQVLEGNNREAITYGNAFFKKCGESPDIRILTHEAHRRLYEWAAARDDASKLIEGNRYNVNYLWWRGQDFQEEGNLAAAEGDFRRAFALCVACYSTISLADVLEKQGRSCEAIYPLQEFLRVVPNANRDMLQGRIDMLASSSRCADYMGSGNASFKLARDGHAHVRAKINGAEAGDFLVDTGASLVTVSGSLAKKIGVQGPYTDIVLSTANGKVSARLGVVDSITVGNLHAKHVEIAVLDSVGSESLLGMSFLSRFDMHMSGGSLTLAQRKHAEP